MSDTPITVKYHTNSRGDRVPCGARKRKCRYAADTHVILTVVASTPDTTAATTVEEVFERTNKKVPPVETERQHGSYSLTIPPHNLEKAVESIEKANRKLERQGLEEKFTYTTETIHETNPETGRLHEFIKISINKPVIKENGWSFIGTLDNITTDNGESELIANSVIGEDINTNFNVTSMVCDQCGQNRSRHKTYVLRNEAGEYKQIGSTCVEGFLGVKPKGLWALTTDPVEEEDMDFGKTGGFSMSNTLVPVKNVIQIALALTEGGKNYVSTQNTSYTSTKIEVMNHMFSSTPAEVDTQKYAKQAETILNNVKYEGDADYPSNMRKLLAQEYVSPKHFGYIVSTIPVYLKQNRAATTPAPVRPKKAKGFLGMKNEKLTDIPVTVERLAHFEVNYGHYPATATMYIMRTPENKLIKWTTTSNNPILDSVAAGTKLNLTRLTIKEYDEFAGEDQTVVKNVGLQLVPTENE